MPPSAALHQFAFSFYLRQNLLQFLFTPNYQEGGGGGARGGDNVFLEYSSGGTATPIPEGDAFLFVRPQFAGAKGKL